MPRRSPPQPLDPAFAKALAALGTCPADALPEALLQAARAAGFVLAGLCDAEPTSRARELADWLSAGKQGSMAWLADDVAARSDPGVLVPGARSLLVVADQYADGSPDPPREPSQGRVARYARGADYHRAIKRRLHPICDALRARFPQHAFRAFSDIEPVLEREHAARARLGWVGKHTLVINPAAGSYLLLGGMITTLHLPAPAPGLAAGTLQPGPVADHCGTCTRCIDACPTRAITPYRVDASRCISYLTIERRGVIPPDRHTDLDNWLFGCDLCQEVCPHNRPSAAERRGPQVAGHYAQRRDAIALLDLLGWSPEDRARHLSGTALKRARFEMLKRNALIAAGNALVQRADPALRAAVERCASDPHEPELVRQTARDVLDRLPASPG
jgi:epoxyqueuosine reductase